MLKKNLSKTTAFVLIILITLFLVGALSFVWYHNNIHKVKQAFPTQKNSAEKAPEKSASSVTTEKSTTTNKINKITDKCKDIQDQKEKNRCYFNLALETKEPFYCRKILSSDWLINEDSCLTCLAAINNNYALCMWQGDFCMQDVFLQNTQLCKNIKTDMLARCKACRLGNPVGAACNREESKFRKKEQCLRDLAIKTNDLRLCDTIGDDECRFDVIVNLDKPEMCQQTKFVNDCLEKLAIKDNNIDLCNKIKYYGTKEECVLGVALRNNDSSLCAHLAQPGLRDRCYYDFGVEVGKKGTCNLCERISNPVAQRYCMFEVTATSSDYKFCKTNVNVEDLVQKYTDKEFGFSFYYPKDYEVKASDKEVDLVGKDAERDIASVKIDKIKAGKAGYWFFSYDSAGGPDLRWTNYIFYDNNKHQCVSYIGDYDDNIITKEKDTNYQTTKMPPVGYQLQKVDLHTMSDIPIFFQDVRFGYDTVLCLSPNKLLKVEINLTEVSTDLLDAFTKTITKVGQEVDSQKLKKTLMEEILNFKNSQGIF